MRTMAILGATGSIGTQALDIIERYPEGYKVVALTANSSAERLFALVRRFKPRVTGLVVEPESIPEDIRNVTQWVFGADCSNKVLEAVKPDIALCAVVGIAGLPAVLTALKVCKRVLLANKEALVTGGHLVMRLARERHTELLPVDSEHSAIFQCLQGANGNQPGRLILTASGGPFRTWNQKAIERATVEDALGHPTWNMGAKITVDCASMMNKGLEVIEARHLFGLSLSQIDVIVHPQSVIHSMVEFLDGSVIAQLGKPDMRGPIGYAMGYPERVAYGGERLDFAKLGQLSFEEPDFGRFPCLRYAYEAQRAGGNMPTILSGANERAVQAFLMGEIPFGGIPRCVDHALQHAEQRRINSIDDVTAADKLARELASERIEQERI